TGRRGMADADHLVGLTLAAVWGSHDLQRVVIANHLETAPERRRDAAVIGIFDHRGELAVLNELPPLAAKLELVARVVDRPGTVRFHVDATLNRRNHLVQAGVPRFQVEIGHTVDGRSIPTAGARVRDAWNVGTDLGRQATEGTQQAAIANEVLALRRLAIVVE